MKKSYIESCSPILFPKMVNGETLEAAGIKHSNLDTYSFILAMTVICATAIAAIIYSL